MRLSRNVVVLGIVSLVADPSSDMVSLLAASVLVGEVWEQISPAATLAMGAVLALAASATLAAGPRAGGQAPAVQVPAGPGMASFVS